MILYDTLFGLLFGEGRRVRGYLELFGTLLVVMCMLCGLWFFFRSLGFFTLQAM